MPNRKALIKNLLALTPAQFELFSSLLDEKKTFQPGNTAEHSTRVVRFVEWAEAPGGCGLAAIEEELNDQGFLKVEPVSKPAGFSTVRRETERFFGRTDKLEELEQFFLFDGKLKIAAAYGLPGVGKTQFALRYANDHHAAYQFTFFIVAATSDSLNEGFSELARRLQLPIVKTEKPSQQDINRSVVDWLENNDGWLAIYDNADDAAILELMFREYLPNRGTGHVLLTTRETTARLVPRAIPLDIFSKDDGAKFLLEKTGQKDEASARQLTQAVGGLPLALDQAVAYIVGTDCSIKSYLENYRKEGKRLRETHNKLASDHDSVATTFSLAFKPIAEKYPATADILRICAFCAPDNIPEELFRNAGDALGDAIAGVIENDLDWDNALKEATRFSLLKRNPETSMLTIHRVVQDVIKDEMGDEEKNNYAMHMVGAIQTGIWRVDSKNLEAGARLTPQAREVSVIVCRFQQVTVWQLNQIADFLQDNIQYAAAQSLFELVLKIEEQKSGREHYDTALAFNNLARIYELQGQYAKAEPLYERALGIFERARGAEHPDTAASLNNLAVLYDSQGRYAEAEPLYERALGIHERALGAEHPDTATSINNLAGLYNSQGRHAEAEPLYERALGIRERALGAEHPDTATSLNNLAFLYDSQGRYAKAEPLYERALGIYERTLGKEHPDTAQSLNDLALFYNAQGRYAEAEPLYKRALGIRERALGAEHPDTAQSLNNLAGLYRSQGRYAEAEPLYERALWIYERALGREHPDTAVTLYCLGILYKHTGRLDNAQSFLKRGLEIKMKAFGGEHPRTAYSQNGLAEIFIRLKNFQEAETLLNQALSTRRRLLGDEHPQTATSINTFGELRYGQGRHGEAETFFLQALDIRRKKLGDEHPDTARTLNHLAELYVETGRAAEARPLFEEALKVFKLRLGDEHPDTKRCAEGLKQITGD